MQQLYKSKMVNKIKSNVNSKTTLIQEKQLLEQHQTQDNTNDALKITSECEHA